MEVLIILGLVGLVFLFIRISNLSTRVSTLEYQLHKQPIQGAKTTKQAKGVSKNITEEGTDLFPWEENQPVKKTKTKATKIIPPAEKPFKLEEFLLKKVIPIAGVITLILAVGFFATWAFSSGWIGPKGRIALGIIFSILVLGLGEFIRPKYPKFFDKISAAGIGGLLVTIYLARNHEFADRALPILTSNQTFIASVITIATGIFLSLRYNTRFLANFTIIGGLISPLMVNSDPNPVGLLSYLAILSVAGFVMSLYKKWPEILGILFVGIIGYEVGLLSLNCFDQSCNHTDTWFIWSLISPLVFLGFTFGLHLLLGSGGIIRKLKNPEIQKGDQYDFSTIFEILLFIISIFTANLIGFFIFENQEWMNFGFFVLAQGFGFFFLSEIFKKKKLEIFREISLGATLISILFATIWEIGESKQFILSMLLAVEGLLILFAGKKFNERVFMFFGRIALALALLISFDIKEFYLATVSIFTVLIGLIYSIGKPSSTFDKIWAFLAVIFTSGQVLYWSFEVLPNFIGKSQNFLSFVLPIIWAIGLAYSVIKTKENISRIFGLIFISFVCLLLGLEAISSNSGPGSEFENFLTLCLLLLGSFSVLSSFFIDEKELQATKSMQKISTITILCLTTISILFFGGENLEEPMRTLFWVVWGGVLFGIGISKSWPHFRYFGIGMFFFLLAKIYFLDVWGWETYEKFLAFFSLGIALLGISFTYYRNKKD